jgi:hypothetical protein
VVLVSSYPATSRLKSKYLAVWNDTFWLELMPVPLISEPLLLAYLLVFGVAALACLVSLPRAHAIDDPDTRRGLVALLLTSGGWATAHFLFFVIPTSELKTVLYLVGLVIGFSAVGPWLYFCSAYLSPWRWGS